MVTENIKVLIIGGGPAGYTAAIYASRANLSPVLYEGIQPGGQLTQTTDVENFPGYPNGIGGFEMMEDIKNQAIRVGADIRSGIVTKVDFSKRPFSVIIDDEKEIIAESVIIATGASAKYLGLPSEEKFKGMGVSACATCDGFFYRKKVVAVVGGGDSALQESLHLSNIAQKVYLVHRRSEFKAIKVLTDRVDEKSNIEKIMNANIVGYETNEEKLSGLLLDSGKKIDVDGLFVYVGFEPSTMFAKDLGITNDKGYIIVNDNFETSINGIYAVGDIIDKKVYQISTAIADGTMAAINVIEKCK